MRFERRLIDALYVEAMVMADDARHYFDEAGRIDRDGLAPLARVSFSCESLKVTTRLMHVIAWLLTQRAVAVGELAPGEALDGARRLGDAPVSDPPVVAALPLRARSLVEGSARLHARVAKLEQAQIAPMPMASPALAMMQRLSGAF